MNDIFYRQMLERERLVVDSLEGKGSGDLLADMRDLRHRQMLDREQAVIDSLEKENAGRHGGAKVIQFRKNG